MFNEIIIGAQNVSDGVATWRAAAQAIRCLRPSRALLRADLPRNTNVATVAAGVTTVGLATTYTACVAEPLHQHDQRC